ncbi:membrane protein DedA with SNARE-associated domain [Rhodobacter viridis]|uniref:Membrane protein DedA with SNARE-associated domain n=1 Tax=Rhodobacter viridis TaxID=1054202 RepID=A0A318TVD8_9RHOB|nr:DedA family protein [Rhodobacter viridis]PYF08772.1 membrane protein DedA with SNARE-associated domain [Rhodobacter viridis]
MSFDTLIQTAGLPGLFLGTMAEGEGVAVLGGVLAHRALFPVEIVSLVVTAGAIAADQLFFALGRLAGQGALAARLLSKGPVQALHRQLGRHQTLSVLGFRFVYGLKIAGAVLIGTSEIGWRRFATLDALSCLVWAHLFVGLGYVAGQAITRFFGDLALHVHLAIAILGVLAAAWALHRILRRR